MRQKSHAQGQHAAAWGSTASKKAQVVRSTAWCPQQSVVLHARGMHTDCRLTVAKCDKQGWCDSPPVWPAQLHCPGNTAATATTLQHEPQQPFPASSGMHSTLLHAQQQQVTQLLRARTQLQCSDAPMQLQQQSNLPVQHPQHVGQRDRTQLCLSHAAAATIIQQRCEDVAYGQEHGCEKLQQQLYPVAQPLHQQLDSSQQAPSQLLQHQPQKLLEQHQQLGQATQLSGLKDQNSQLQCHQDQQQRLQAAQHPAQLTGWIRHSSTVQELRQLHNAHSSRFNHINIAAMLVKLAKLACTCASERAADACSSSSSSHDVQQFALQLAQQLVLRLHECDTARQIANASWALAVLQCAVPTGFLQHAAQQLVAQDNRMLAASQPQELAMLAWAFAKLQHDSSCALWPRLVAVVQTQLHRLKPQELTMLMWSLAHLQRRHQQRWRAGAAMGMPGTLTKASGASNSSAKQQGQRLASVSEQLLPQQLGDRCSSNAAASTSAAAPGRPMYSTNAGAFGGVTSSSDSSRSPVPASGKNGSTNNSRQSEGLQQQQLQQLLPAVCSTVCQQLEQGSHQYRAKELASLLWSSAVLNLRDAQMLHLIGDSLQQLLLNGHCNAQDISNSIWALGKLRICHKQLLAAAADTAPAWLRLCDRQELSLVVVGCAGALQQARCREAKEQAAAAVHLWQLCTEEVQRRLLLDEAGSWGLAECATLLQAVALVLQPPERARNRQRQQRQQQQQRQQRQQGSSGNP